MMNFFETRMGNKFFMNDVPKLIKSIERVADAMEKANERAAQKEKAEVTVRDTMMARILRFAREEDFSVEVCREQLRALWTAYCIFNDYEVDTAPYDNAIAGVWNAVIESREIAGSSDIFDDFECFDGFMCEELV